MKRTNYDSVAQVFLNITGTHGFDLQTQRYYRRMRASPTSNSGRSALRANDEDPATVVDYLQ